MILRDERILVFLGEERIPLVKKNRFYDMLMRRLKCNRRKQKYCGTFVNI